MNIPEIKEKLYDWFSINDRLILPDDTLKILVITEQREFDQAILEDVLKWWVENGLLHKVRYIENKKNKIGYILDKPLYAYEQTIVIPGETCGIIAKFINQSKDKDDKNYIDPIKITHVEIEYMVGLLGQYILKCNQLQEEIDKNNE